MPTNNILLFDQNKGNMLNDSAYNTNQQRLNGVQSGIASSQLQNKFQYQVSLVAYAIASIMYNNGMDANDADAVSAFVSNMSNTLVQKVLDKASTQEAQAGTVDTKWMSPSLVKAAIDFTSVKLSGSTMTGPLILSGDPMTNLQAATKQYVDNSVANVKLKYIGRFNLQGTQEITILSQTEADKYTLYYFCACFARNNIGISVHGITTNEILHLFDYQSSSSNTYGASMMFNNVNGNSCSAHWSDNADVRAVGRVGRFTGRISITNVTSGSFVDVYAL